MTPDTRYVSTKCFSSDKEEKNQGGTAESFVPTKGGWFLFYVLKDVYRQLRNSKKLRELYEEGRRIGQDRMKDLRKYLEC